ERRAAGKRQRIDVVDRHGGIEQGGLAGAPTAAAHVHGGGRPPGEDDGGGARSEAAHGPLAPTPTRERGGGVYPARHVPGRGNRTLNINRMCVAADQE